MRLEWKDDLDLDMIAESGQCFRWQKTGQEGEYRIPFRRELLYIRRIDDTHFDLSCTERQFERTWRSYFDLGRCYRDIRSMVCEEEDPVLYRAQQLGAGIRVLGQDPWEMLITFIISQRKNIPAIRLAVEKLARAAGDPLEGRNGEIVWSFPTAEQIAGMSEQALAEVKLGYREKYVRKAAEDAAAGRICLEEMEQMDLEYCGKALREIYGVGRKVADCVALFGLHQLDAFPRDVWINRGLAEDYGGEENFPYDRYHPYNGIMQQYLFEYFRNRPRETGSFH